MTLKLLPLFLLQPAGARLILGHHRPVLLALAMRHPATRRLMRQRNS